MDNIVDVHYGHLCSIRVSKFEVVDAFGGGRAASVVFQVQANKTRAYRSFSIRVPHESGAAPIATVRSAWKQLTGHDISLDGASVPGDAPTAGQEAMLGEIKEFVRTETEKIGASLTLDVV